MYERERVEEGTTHYTDCLHNNNIFMYLCIYLYAQIFTFSIHEMTHFYACPYDVFAMCACACVYGMHRYDRLQWPHRFIVISQCCLFDYYLYTNTLNFHCIELCRSFFFHAQKFNFCLLWICK